jgi:hypothetical protein
MSKRVRRGRKKDERGMLERILDTPHLEHVVPRLPPELLHRLIRTCGLEDCGDLVALATPGQLQQVFDVDLWRAPRPGLDEELDPDRFGVWLDVLLESGATVAAQKIAGTDVDLVIAALARQMLVFDAAAVASFETGDGEVIERRRPSDGLNCEVGGYQIAAKRRDGWDSIVALLLALDAEHPDYFHRVMRGCRTLSNSGFEIDGLHNLLDDTTQDMFDLAVDREQRREKQGYVTPAQARAFLQAARELQLSGATPPPPHPIARAYFRAIERVTPADADANGAVRLLNAAASGSPDVPPGDGDAVAAVVDLLREGGVLPQEPRALLEAPRDDQPQLARIQAHLQLALDLDPGVYAARTEELAYLANALVAGCSIQARPFTEREASDAVLAICNLGLEHWPRHWLPADAPVSEDLLAGRDLISVFQVGWMVLHRDVCLYATARLISVLDDLRCDDRDIQSSLDALRIDLMKHAQQGAPWGARDSLDVIAILDMPAWAALLGLIDECPVMHAALGASAGSGIRTVSATAFTFISESSQIAAVREFMRSLPSALGG